MKRLISLLLASILTFSLTACGSSGSQSSQMEQPLENSSPIEGPTPEVKNTVIENPTKASNVLVAYFSMARIVTEGMDAVSHATPYVGNTESVAFEIQKQTGGDIFAIITEKSYPVDHKEASAIVEEEVRSDVRPALTTHVENRDNYDVIFLGYPIWWYIEPMAIRTFLEEYDFSGKTIIPFCTSLGVDINESIDDIKGLCPDATVIDGLRLSTGRENESEKIPEWLSELDLPE